MNKEKRSPTDGWPDTPQGVTVSVAWWFRLLILCFAGMFVIPLGMMLTGPSPGSQIVDIALAIVGTIFAVGCWIWTSSRRVILHPDGRIESGAIGKSRTIHVSAITSVSENSERLRLFESSGKSVAVPVWISNYRSIRAAILRARDLPT